MAEEKIKLSKRDRFDACMRSTFLQGSWNYERSKTVGMPTQCHLPSRSYTRLKKTGRLP